MGYAGARVDVIAERAGLNKRMLYHYFGDKTGLYRAVLEDRLQNLVNFASGADGDGNLDEFVARLDATLARLLLWDLLRPGAADAERDSELFAGAGLTRALGALPEGRSMAVLAPMLMAFLVVSRARGDGAVEGDVLSARLRELLDAVVRAPAGLPVKPRIRLKPAGVP
jgi:AcrR family transcriptional regulator